MEVTKRVLQPITSSEKVSFLNIIKQKRIEMLNKNVDAAYKQYLSQYPELEQASFTQKAQEAFRVVRNEDIDLSETPYLSSLTNDDKNLRNELAKAVNEKVKFITNLEAWTVKVRDSIKGAETADDVEKIDISIPSMS